MEAFSLNNIHRFVGVMSKLTHIKFCSVNTLPALNRWYLHYERDMDIVWDKYIRQNIGPLNWKSFMSLQVAAYRIIKQTVKLCHLNEGKLGKYMWQIWSI